MHPIELLWNLLIRRIPYFWYPNGKNAVKFWTVLFNMIDKVIRSLADCLGLPLYSDIDLHLANNQQAFISCYPMPQRWINAKTQQRALMFSFTISEVTSTSYHPHPNPLHPLGHLRCRFRYRIVSLLKRDHQVNAAFCPSPVLAYIPLWCRKK